jgi:hypothetical protein
MGRESRTLKLVKPPPPDEDEAVAQILAYADQVADPVHWAQMLDSTDPTTRANLEAVIGPYLRWRRCRTPDCDSTLPPIWQPTLLIACTGTETLYETSLELRYCERCQADIQLGDLLTDDIWQQVLDQCLAEGEHPRRWLTRLRWDRLQ